MDLPERALPGALRLMRANRAFASADQARRRVAERVVRPLSYAPPRRLRRDVEVGVERVPGIGGWPVYTLRPRGAGAARGAVVYAHGGGWVGEVAPQHWHLVAQVAAEAGTTVLLPIYPLVPFGTAGEVVHGVAALVRDARERHGPTCLAGDSAGGQIALSSAQVLRDEDGVTLPRTLLISPSTDLRFANPRIPVVQPSDPWLGTPGATVFAEHWRGDLPLTDPVVSPLLGDLAGLGPLTVMIGTRDICWPDSELLRDRAREAGVEVDYREQEGQLHVYPLLPTPGGRAGRGEVVDLLRAGTRG